MIPGWPAQGEHFSVLLDFNETTHGSIGEAKVEFMSWSLVVDYLRLGAVFLVMEGPRVVAHACVTAVFEGELP